MANLSKLNRQDIVLDAPEGYFALDVLRVKPNNLQSYRSHINIDNLDCIIEVGYNSRLKKRYISVITSNGTVLLERTFLDIGRRVDLNNNAVLLGLQYYVTLEVIGVLEEDIDFFNWSDTFNISFVGCRTEVYNTLHIKLRNQIVGN